MLCDLDALEATALLVADGMGVSLVPQWPDIERFAVDCRVLPIAGTAYARQVVLASPVAADCRQLLTLLEGALTAQRN